MAFASKLFSDQQKMAQARLSSAAVQYLDYVEAHPALLSKAHFQQLAQVHKHYPSEYQPWPILFGPNRQAQIANCAKAIDNLVKSLFGRYFHNDVARLAQFLDLPEDQVGLMFSSPNFIDEAISRTDCLLTDEGFKCMELNCGSNVAGWELQQASYSALSDPVNAAFFQAAGIAATHHRSLDITTRFLIELALKHASFDGKSLTVAITVPPLEETRYLIHNPWQYKASFERCLSQIRPGLKGRCLVCFASDLEVKHGRVQVHGQSVSVIFEHHGDVTPFQVLRVAKMGDVVLLTGPATGLLLDKRFLALLSQYGHEPMFSAEEQVQIQTFLPWTRLANSAATTFRGETVAMAELLAHHREELVLKDATESGGKGVFVGRFCDQKKWDDIAAKALRDPHFIVQEYLYSEPFTFQCGSEGWKRHDVAWGFLHINGHFAGNFVRMMPVGGAGVVNAAQGASVGFAIDVDRD